jgi:hypothetical protein
MNKLFWILWVVEFILAAWWIITEMQLTYLKPNPFAFLSIAYLVLILAVRFGAGFTKLSMGMVIVPAIPLSLMAFIIIVSVVTGAKWN